MKKIFILLLAFSIFSFSCKKKNSNSSNPSTSNYIGNWLWTSTYGIRPTYPAPDTSIFLCIQSGGNYQISSNGVKIYSGTYHIDSNAARTLLVFDNITTHPPVDNSHIVGTANSFTPNLYNFQRFFLFQNNATSAPRNLQDSLTLVLYPIIPEAPVSIFKRVFPID